MDEPRSRDDGRYLVRSVDRGLRIVDFIAEGPPEGASITEIARAIGVSKSTAFATVHTLVQHGYLRDEGPGPRYRLGMALIRLGDLVVRQVPVGQACRPVLRDLADKTGMTSRVALAEGCYPVFVERVDGSGAVRFHTPLGRREPPHTSAAGKAILAALPGAEVRGLAAETGLPRSTAHTITTVASLLEDVALTRRRGFSIDDEEDAEGVFCVGAAFFDHNDHCLGAISVTDVKTDLPAWRIEELGRTVRDSADQISAMMGGKPYLEIAAVLDEVAGHSEERRTRTANTGSGPAA